MTRQQIEICDRSGELGELATSLLSQATDEYLPFSFSHGL
jgi:hypothetical protein